MLVLLAVQGGLAGAAVGGTATASLARPGPQAESPPAPAPAPPTPAPPPAAPPADAGALDPNSPLAPMPDIGVAWPDLTNGDAEQAATARPTDAAGLTRYSYRIEGIEAISDPVFQARFDTLSSLRMHDGEAANAAQIDRRAREDAALLTTLLRGLGYYDARVTTAVAPVNGVPRVTLSADIGQLYRFAAIDLDGLRATGAQQPALTDKFGVKPGDPINADAVANGQDALRVALGNAGFPFAKVGQSAITVDHADRSGVLALNVDPGGFRRFGRVVTASDRPFDARHVQRIARFKPGQPYDAAAIDDLRRTVIQTGLVAVVDIKPVDGATPGTVDIAVKMDPAPPRTIAGEVGYGTGEGVRAEVSWTHRNLFPPEGGLTVRGALGTQERSGGVIFRRNNFEGRDRVLTAQVTASDVRRAAYQATTFSIGGSLERQTNIFFQKAWTWSLGADLAASDERDVLLSTGATRRRTFFIAALPVNLNYDGSDDLLNPRRGFRVGGRVSPELSLQGTAFGYAKVQIDASAYQPVTEGLVVAGRIRLGTIIGAPRDAIAPSRRFYAGGGASIRGYGFQGIGPRDPNNDPIGGRSLTEFSLEARIRAFGRFGLVPFFDAGNIYVDPLPRFRGLQYGAGLGLRYYSNFGPIRIDLGTPINPQPGDPRVAVYVSLGQAF